MITIHKGKTYSTNITLDVKPQRTDINTYSLNQLEDDKHIYKPIHDSEKQINTNMPINIIVIIIVFYLQLVQRY